jgi:hypothetical protein
MQEATKLRKREDTPQAKAIMSLMEDAQKSLAALRRLRLEAKEKEDRLKLNKKAIEIAKKANEAWEKKRGGLQLRRERKSLQKRAGIGPKRKTTIPKELQPSAPL